MTTDGNFLVNQLFSDIKNLTDRLAESEKRVALLEEQLRITEKQLKAVEEKK